MLSGYDPEPVREQDSQLLGRLPPVLHRLGPLLPDSRKCKIYKFFQCDIRCKHALVLGYLTELALIAFHGILCFCRWRTSLWFCPQVNPQGSFHVCVQLGDWKYRPGRAVCLWSLLPSRSVHACSCGRGGGTNTPSLPERGTPAFNCSMAFALNCSKSNELLIIKMCL